MNLQEQDRFYRAFTNDRSKSKAASSRVTEVTNGLLVSKPVKEPEITILNDGRGQSTSNAASVPGINKMKAINNFIKSNGRI
jgi:hypothetical protein